MIDSSAQTGKHHPERCASAREMVEHHRPTSLTNDVTYPLARYLLIKDFSTRWADYLNYPVLTNVRLKRPREPYYASSVQRIPRLDVLDRNARKLESGKRSFFRLRKGIPTFFPHKIPANLGELTVHLSHLYVKKPSLVTFRDSYLRPPVQKAGVAPLAKAKDRRRPFLGAPWAGSRACAEPSKAEFADLKRGWLRQPQPFRSGPATPAAGRNRRLRHAWRGTEGIRWPWPRAQSADRTGRISWR